MVNAHASARSTRYPITYGLPESPLTRWSAGYRSKRWEQRAIALYGEGHTYRRRAIGATRFVTGSRAKLAYIGALAFPAPTYLAQREGSVLRRAPVPSAGST